MSKNSYRPGVNQYANQEEARRKARGNPNKNVHQKKKNSNYAGYAGNPVTQKIIEKANQQERVKLPTWLNIWLAVLFAAIIVVLILRLLPVLPAAGHRLPVPVLYPPLQAHEKGEPRLQDHHRGAHRLRRHLHVYGRGGPALAGWYPVKNRFFRQNSH